MASVRTYLHSLAVGVHDTTALTRIDLERMRLAAETQTNLLPKATGPAFMRPGLEYLFTTTGTSLKLTWLSLTRIWTVTAAQKSGRLPSRRHTTAATWMPRLGS